MGRNNAKTQLFFRDGYAMDFGYIAFSTTDAEVEIFTPLSKVYFSKLQIAYGSGDTDPIAGSNEHLWLDEEVHGVDGSNAGGTSVSLRRAAEPFYLSGVGSTDYITDFDYVEVPIGVAPVAGTLNQAWYYNDVKSGGTPLLNIGHVPTSGTGTADIDEFTDNGDAIASPNDSVGKTITTFTATAVGALDLITFGTTGGTTPNPQGGLVAVKITPTLTSGLVVYYKLIGID